MHLWKETVRFTKTTPRKNKIKPDLLPSPQSKAQKFNMLMAQNTTNSIYPPQRLRISNITLTAKTANTNLPLYRNCNEFLIGTKYVRTLSRLWVQQWAGQSLATQQKGQTAADEASTGRAQVARLAQCPKQQKASYNHTTLIKFQTSSLQSHG